MSESIRQRKFASLIHRTLSTLFQHTKLSFLREPIFSISGVRMSPDLGLAKVYVSMTFVKNKNAFIETLNEHKKEIRNLLGSTIKKQVRAIPSLAFYIDDLEENAQRIEAIIKTLDIPPPEQES